MTFFKKKKSYLFRVFRSCFTELMDATSHLLRYSLSRLLRVAALVNDVTDLLAVHYEVNAICGECQERVVDMVQLKKEKQCF